MPAATRAPDDFRGANSGRCWQVLSATLKNCCAKYGIYFFGQNPGRDQPHLRHRMRRSHAGYIYSGGVAGAVYSRLEILSDA